MHSVRGREIHSGELSAVRGGFCHPSIHPSAAPYNDGPSPGPDHDPAEAAAPAPPNPPRETELTALAAVVLPLLLDDVTPPWEPPPCPPPLVQLACWPVS